MSTPTTSAANRTNNAAEVSTGDKPDTRRASLRATGAARSFADRTRPPTGRPSNPVILLAGSELSGKTYASLLLTASDRVGKSWMMQLGETDGDPYGAIVDAQGRPVRYELVEHDGTWRDIMAAAQQIHDAATAEHEAGAKPPVWIFDSMSLEWELLTAWANNRAAESAKNKAKVAADPNAEIDVGHMYWNSVNRRHARLLTLFRTFPGIVVLTARGKWVTKFDAKGQPTREKEYTLDAQKQLGFHCGAWVRLSREEPPTIVGARLARGGIVPGIDPELVIDGRRDQRFRDVTFSLEWLIFDKMGYDPANADVRTSLNEPRAGSEPDDIEAAEAAGVSPRCADLGLSIVATTTIPALTAVWEAIKEAVKTEEITIAEANTLRGMYQAKGAELGARPRQQGRAAS